MRRIKASGGWVIYRMTIRGTPGANAVCEQWEWNAIELCQPGYHVLLRSGIGTEVEAEKLARGTSGDTYRRRLGRKART